MKKIFALIAFFTLTTISLFAQTLSVDAESGNRAIETGNCWAMGSVSYTSTAAQVITGKWSMRSNSPTSLDPQACWVKSPWLKPASGNITLNIKFESNTAATLRRIIALYIPYDPTSPSGFAEGKSVRFDSTEYKLPLPTTSQSIAFSMPNAIANSGLPYKIQLSFVGSGGTTRYNMDDLVIPGTYFADPTNNCLPVQEKPDADKDGVLDTDDAYPNDATRAYNTFLPAKESGTLLFEDAWPKNGDYDFNDLVLGYRYTLVTNANNKVVELKGQLIVKAIGANYKNGFGLQLDNLSPDLITSISGTKIENPSWLQLNGNGTEAAQKYANIIVIDNASRLMPAPSGQEFVNTEITSKYITPDTTNFVIVFASNKVDTKEININPYLIVNQERSNEVHLADRAPTDKANLSNFGTGDDDSKIGEARYYKNKSNLPWALDIPATVTYSIERKEITQGYLNLAKWAQSNGFNFVDWYQDIPGYRDAKNLYGK